VFTISFIPGASVNAESHVVTRTFRAIGLLLAGVAAAVWYVERPVMPRALPALPTETARLVRGVFHVHSERSDGSGNIEGIAAAAARVGLDFVIFADHGDATREPDAPGYVAGVLCIDAVEISTDHGHVVALGLPRSPYPLGGEARDVIDDVVRLGGFAIAAHPDSTKEDLRWTAVEAPVGGIEWLNGDSEWRDESFRSLVRALFMYPAYGTASLSTLLDRPVASLQRWDALTTHRRVVAIAASDAHARLGLRPLDTSREIGSSLDVPSYEDIFRMFSNVLPSARLSGDAEQDARTVLAAIRNGHLYSIIDGIAGPGSLSFSASSGTETASFGDILPIAGPVTVRVAVQGPDDAVVTLFKDGHALESHSGSSIERAVEEEPAAYRVEVSLPGAPGEPPAPWMVSNPIYVGRTDSTSPAPIASPRPAEVAIQYRDGPASGWTVERSDASLGALDEIEAEGGRQLSLRYALGGTASSSAYTAFVMPAGAELPAYDRLVFTGRSDRPMRLSVQLRAPDGAAGQRWHRSVYLEPAEREITVWFDDMLPRGTTATPKADLARVESVLFVVDTVNTPMGGNGRLWLDDVRYGR
jgi:hypothetical protein